MRKKKFILLYVFLCVFLTNINSQIHSTANPNRYIGFQTTSYYNQPIKEYHSCNDYSNSYNDFNYNKVGYSTQSFGYSTYNTNRYFNINNYPSGSGSHRTSGPRRVSGWGWVDWIVWGRSHGVPSSASNEDMEAYYNYCDNGGTMSYDEWYEYTYGSGSEPGGPPSPDDPFGDPIGNNILPLLLMSLTYFIYKRKKLKTVSI